VAELRAAERCCICDYYRLRKNDTQQKAQSTHHTSHSHCGPYCSGVRGPRIAPNRTTRTRTLWSLLRSFRSLLRSFRSLLRSFRSLLRSFRSLLRSFRSLLRSFRSLQCTGDSDGQLMSQIIPHYTAQRTITHNTHWLHADVFMSLQESVVWVQNPCSL
jgi:hypothetical protein